ncbi:hypothetical protein DV736_g1825, partial [Chaetothyriales sp. CBS 134916]
MKAQTLIFVAELLLGTAAATQQCLGECQQSALAFAYQYGYPLYAYGLLAHGLPTGEANKVFVSPILLTAASTSVVRPNVDTLYALILYDLSKADLEFTVPDVDSDRFWVFPFYDLYGNNFASICSIYGYKPGKYLLRPAQDDVGVQTQDIADGYLAYVNSPTPYGFSIVRILVRDGSTDLEYVRELENNITLASVKGTRGTNIPAFDLDLFASVIHNSSLSNAEQVLQLTAAFAPYNLPEVQSDQSWVNRTLEHAGIRGQTFTQPKGTNLTAAATTANASSNNFFLIAGMSINLGHNWTQVAPQAIGDYGSYYNARQAIAMQAYAALTADIAIYPSYGAELGLGLTFPQGPKQAYLVTFSGKPVLEPTGFWSLTVYNADLYLVPNELNRYALNDRSNLTYPDGCLVYGNASSNGEFQILLQSSDVPPPKNWTNNWLPTPAGGGRFYDNLRFYGAAPAITNGSYVYPTVTLIDAITT